MYEELEKILCRLLGLIYRKEALSEKIQNILKKDWLQNKVNLLDVNQLDIAPAAQTALKEALIKSEKKQRYLLDYQLVIRTVLNIIEETSLRFNLVKLASCLAPKHIVENRETSANRLRLMVDGLSCHKEITFKFADETKFQLKKQSFSFNEMVKFDYLNDRWDVFLGEYFSGKEDLCCVCVSQFSFFPMGRVLLNVVFLSKKS